MITPEDIQAVSTLLGRSIGNPERRAAKSGRDRALVRLMAAARRGEPTSVVDSLRGEYESAHRAYRIAMGWHPDE